MAGLIGSLINGAHALAVQQAGVQTAGRNLANINTPNYSRQRINLGDRAIVEGNLGTVGTGVEALGIQQMRDALLDTEVINEASQTASLNAQQSALEKAEGNLGESIDRSTDSATIGTANGTSTGIASAINSFFNGFDEIAANPSDVGAKQVLLQRADLLVSKINVADQRLTNLQADLTSQVTSDVPVVNGILGQIADLNGQIQQAEIRNQGSSVDLKDQRQGKLEELAKYLNFTAPVIPGAQGQIQIIAQSSGGAAVTLVDRTTVRGSLSFSGSTFSAGTPSTALALTGGSLQGNVTARDGAIAQLRTDLQKSAQQITAGVNAAYNPGGTRTNFFAASPSTGLIALDPSLTVSSLRATNTTSAGANEIALAVADVAQKKFSTSAGDYVNGTIGDAYKTTVSGFGAKLSNLNAKLSDQTSVQELVTKQRDSVSGVSMDEEVADLMRYQRAYQAAARVVNVIDSMLDTLINSLGR